MGVFKWVLNYKSLYTLNYHTVELGVANAVCTNESLSTMTGEFCSYELKEIFLGLGTVQNTPRFWHR